VSQDITNQSEHRPAESSLYTPAIFFKQNRMHYTKINVCKCIAVTLHCMFNSASSIKL